MRIYLQPTNNRDIIDNEDETYAMAVNVDANVEIKAIAKEVIDAL